MFSLAISVILVESHLLIHLLTDDIPETSVSLDRETLVDDRSLSTTGGEHSGEDDAVDIDPFSFSQNRTEVFSVFVLSWHHFNFCAPYSKMAENFKPKANTLCMHGWRRIISCKGLGKRVCSRLN